MQFDRDSLECNPPDHSGKAIGDRDRAGGVILAVSQLSNPNAELDVFTLDRLKAGELYLRSAMVGQSFHLRLRSGRLSLAVLAGQDARRYVREAMNEIGVDLVTPTTQAGIDPMLDHLAAYTQLLVEVRSNPACLEDPDQQKRLLEAGELFVGLRNGAERRVNELDFDQHRLRHRPF